VYNPPRVKKICLEDLISFNFNTTFGGDSNVNCSNCRIQTSHKLTREQLPDILCFEIIRVTERKYQGAFIWSKNSIPISFPTDGIKVPGSNKKYRVMIPLITKAHFTLVTGLQQFVRKRTGISR